MSQQEHRVRPVGVVSVGAAVPSGRLAAAEIAGAWDQKGGRGVVAVCGPDEDTLTLAWSAAGEALAAAGLEADQIDGLWWGTARPPLAEGPSLSFLSAAVGVRADAAGLLAGGSPHAGMDALVAAWDALAAGVVRHALVVASDALVPGPRTAAERETGAGAVALVLSMSEGEDGAAGGANAAPAPAPAPAPARLVDRVVRTVPLLDRYRGDGDAATGDPYDPRLYRERELTPGVVAIATAVAERHPAAAGEARWSVPDPDGRLGKVVGKAARLGTLSSESVHGRIGDTGSAAPFMGLLSALADAGPAVMVGFGGGRTSAVVLEVDGAVPGAAAALAVLDGGDAGTRPVSYASVLRSRGQLVPQSDPVAMGVPPGSAAFVRGNLELLSLQGRRCLSCHTIAVPPSIHPVCPGCGAAGSGGGGELVALERKGVIHTFVINHTMPPPFEAPLPLAVVDLSDGSRVLLQGLPEDAASMAVGDPVHLVLRRYAVERGVPVYGFKVQKSVSDADGEAELVGAGVGASVEAGVGANSNGTATTQGKEA